MYFWRTSLYNGLFRILIPTVVFVIIKNWVLYVSGELSSDISSGKDACLFTTKECDIDPGNYLNKR